MPSFVNKTLQGSQELLGVGGVGYVLQLPTNVSPRPNALAQYNFEECYINVDTSNFACGIFLPKISDFNGDRSVKIYISNNGNSGNIVGVYSYSPIEPTVLDRINGDITVSIQPNETGWFQIVSNNNWAYFCTPLPA